MCYNLYSHVSKYFSLTEIPTVESKSMGQDLGVFFEEANEFDLTHDVMLEVEYSLVFFLGGGVDF